MADHQRPDLTFMARSPSLFRDFLLESPGYASIGEAELFLIKNRDIPSLTKSWIVIRVLGLFDGLIREELARGFQPWNGYDANSPWVFNSLDTSVGELSIAEAEDEWKACMLYWINKTIKGKWFEVYNMFEDELGIRMRTTCHISVMLSKLAVFLQPISRECYYFLESLNYELIHRCRGDQQAGGEYLYYLCYGPGTLPRMSNVAHLRRTETISRVLVHFQCGWCISRSASSFMGENASKIFS